MLKVNLNQKKTLIVGIYVPNEAKERGFNKISKKLQPLIYDQMIILRYFNGIVDSQTDRTGGKGKLCNGNSQRFFLITRKRRA